jgi:hypothetical protein
VRGVSRRERSKKRERESYCGLHLRGEERKVASTPSLECNGEMYVGAWVGRQQGVRSVDALSEILL